MSTTTPPNIALKRNRPACNRSSYTFKVALQFVRFYDRLIEGQKGLLLTPEEGSISIFTFRQKFGDGLLWLIDNLNEDLAKEMKFTYRAKDYKLLKERIKTNITSEGLRVVFVDMKLPYVVVMTEIPATNDTGRKTTVMDGINEDLNKVFPVTDDPKTWLSELEAFLAAEDKTFFIKEQLALTEEELLVCRKLLDGYDFEFEVCGKYIKIHK